jgi:hypothetical protein
MEAYKSGLKYLKDNYYISSQKKYLIFTLFVLVLLILFSGGFGLVDFLDKNLQQSKKNVCGDDTPYNICSSVKPYFCLNGEFVDLASACGCPKNFVKKNNLCISPYQKNPKTIHLKYTLRGEDYMLDFVVYGDFADYVSKVPRSIYYADGDISSRVDFKLKAINEEEQKKFLMPLVVKIQNITSDKEDQARIAISLVQNIPFGASNKTLVFGSSKLNYSRYPYEVLYDMEGICGERTDLLAFLLREIGYGTASFYYPSYNHEVLGIKCPIKESLIRSGYCFVETTGPSIITDSEISYIGVGRLYSSPEIYPISDGISLGENLQEYSDARKLIGIRDFIDKNGWLGPLKDRTLEKLKQKYGLVDEYNSG